MANTTSIVTKLSVEGIEQWLAAFNDGRAALEELEAVVHAGAMTWAEYNVHSRAITKELDELAVTLKENEDAAKQLDKETRTLGETTGEWIKKIAALVAAYVTLRAATKFVKDITEEALKADNEWNELVTTLKITGREIIATSEAVKTLGDSMEKTTRFTGGSVMEAAKLLSVFKDIESKTFPRVIQLAGDMARVLGGDVAQKARQLGRALEDPTKASGVLKQAGLDLSDATKKTIEVLVEQGDVAQAQVLIMEELEASYAGAAFTLGETLTDKIEIASNRWTKMKETIGTELLPTIEALLPLLEVMMITLEQSAIAADFDPLNQQLSQMEKNVIMLTTRIANLGDTFTIMSDQAVQFWATYSLPMAKAALGGVVWNGAPQGLKDAFKDNIVDATVAQSAMNASLAQQRLNDIENASIEAVKAERAAKAKILADREAAIAAGKVEKDYRDLFGTNANLDSKKDREKADKKRDDAEAAESKRLDAVATKEWKAHDKEVADKAKSDEKFREKHLKDFWDNVAKKTDVDRKARDDAAKKDKAFEANFEDLHSLSKRITAAAASQSPEQKIEKAVIEAGVKNVQAVEANGKVLGALHAGQRGFVEALEKAGTLT